MWCRLHIYSIYLIGQSFHCETCAHFYAEAKQICNLNLDNLSFLTDSEILKVGFRWHCEVDKVSYIFLEYFPNFLTFDPKTDTG